MLLTHVDLIDKLLSYTRMFYLLLLLLYIIKNEFYFFFFFFNKILNIAPEKQEGQ